VSWAHRSTSVLARPPLKKKQVLVELSPALGASELAGHPIEAVLRRARGLATSLAKMKLRRTFEELAPACPRVCVVVLKSIMIPWNGTMAQPIASACTCRATTKRLRLNMPLWLAERDLHMVIDVIDRAAKFAESPLPVRARHRWPEISQPSGAPSAPRGPYRKRTPPGNRIDGHNYRHRRTDYY
jgi:hypothetical protein